MSNGRVIRSGCIIEVHSGVIEATRDDSYDGDKPGEGAGSASRHAWPFIESIRGVDGRQRDSMVNCVNPDKRSNTENTEPPQRVSRTSSTRGVAIWEISVVYDR